MKKILALAVLLCAAAAASGEGRPWATPAEADRMAQELQDFLRGAEVRYPGSAGNLAMEEKIGALFAASGLQHGEIKFRTACFVPGETALILPNQPPIRVYPLHPTLFRPGNFKEKEFNAPLVYLGRGSNDDLARFKGARLEGALALMEFDCGTDWMRLLRFGVKGFIFIEPEGYEYDDALAKLCNTEVAIPRFLASRTDGAILKTAATLAREIHVKANPSRWENKFLRDLWVLIPGSSSDFGHEVAVVVAPIDSNCIVPEMATGVQAGANLFCLTRLLNDLARKPPARSVLLVAVNAHVLWNQGERVLAWHTLAKEEAVEELRNELNNDLRIQQLLIDYYSRLRLDGYCKADEDLLISWKSLVDKSTDKNISVKAPLVSLAKRDLNRLKNEQLLLYQQQLPDKEAKRRTGKFEEQREKYVRVLALFNKFGLRTKLSDLSGEEIRILKGYVQEVINYNTICAGLNEQDLLLEKQNDAVREAIKGSKISFMICLALDWNSPQIGFSAGKEAYWSRNWGANTLNIAEQLAEVRQSKTNFLADTLTQRGALPYEYYFLPHQDGACLALQRASHMAAFDLFNVFTSGDNIFLPSDTIEELNKANFASEAAFLASYLRALFNAPNITSPSELDYNEIRRNWKSISAHQVKTFKFDELSESVVPELPVPNTVTVFIDQETSGDVYKKPLQSSTVLGDVCSSIILLTDQRATTALYGPYLSIRSPENNLTAMAFHCDDDFITVDHVIDAGEIQKKMYNEYMFKFPTVTLALFECREFPIYPIADSSLVGGTPIFIKDMIPLTGKGNSSPRKYGLTSIGSVLSLLKVRASAGAPAAFYFTPAEKIKLVTGAKRLALNADEKDCEGKGYGSAKELDNDFFRAVTRDMSILNHARIKKLGEVADDLVREFVARGDRCLHAFNTVLAESDYLQYLRKLYEGLGAQVKAYEQNRQITNDMLKAVVVYMALLLPFCFFIQKLLFNFVKIEHEMAMFAVFFVITFLIFQVIHPAFRVTQAAGVIFIAFIMGVLGLFVVNILRGRFESEMQLIFRSYLSGTMDEAGYSTVTQKAMLIGVNNMKRRRIRTILTTMTIMLIAFAMLSFTSISRKINPTIICKSKTPPYTGFMFHWPGNSQMEEATFEIVRDLFGAYGETVVRRWKTMNNNVPFHVSVNNGKETMVEAILGLTTMEDGFLSKFPIVSGRFFSANDAHEALISSQMAANLAIDPAKLDGIVINCQGYDLRVVGIYDDDKIKNLKDLNDISILPIKGIVSQLSSSINMSGGGKAVQEELNDLGMLVFVDPLSLLIVPCDITRRMHAFPYSVAVKLKDNAPVWPLMDIMLTSTMAKFYISSLTPFAVGNESKQTVAAGAYYVGSNYKTSVGGLAILLIPLFIAGTIILNTMLGSVYERKKEIAVYNAIGLNPHHIGLFFLAESFVYGVIGSVGGYLIGQVLSSALKYSGLVKDINFNYSSLSVAYVIIFTVAIVLLSTIYPAMAAVRTAVPSGKRSWSMPPHKDNNMEVVFPFIYHPRIAAGILAYLQEYFARFTEVSIGDLIAVRTIQERAKDEKGRERFKLGYHIALAPYDLGVTENIKFNLSYDDYVRAYRLILDIERVSGQDVNWVTTNRPFLEQLRKYLMRWRNLDPGQLALYVKQSADLMVRS